MSGTAEETHNRDLACFIVLPALFSALVILWMGAQTPPDHGSWSSLFFWRSLPIALGASLLILVQGVRLAVSSKYWSITLSVSILLGVVRKNSIRWYFAAH
jgi:hypothetical protein